MLLTKAEETLISKQQDILESEGSTMFMFRRAVIIVREQDSRVYRILLYSRTTLANWMGRDGFSINPATNIESRYTASEAIIESIKLYPYDNDKDNENV